MKLRSPSEHAAYNATHYPGTRQLCCLCGEETERCELEYMAEPNFPRIFFFPDYEFNPKDFK